MKLIYHHILFIISAIILIATIFYVSSNIGNSTGISVYFDGEKNVECHSIQVDDGNFLETYHFETECKDYDIKQKDSEVVDETN